jgi:hypothetical protein
LYGLQNMSSDKTEVLQLVSALVPKVASCSETLSAQAVGNALLGLSNIDVPVCKPLVEGIVLRMFDICSLDSIRLSDFAPLISGADALIQSSLYANATWVAELESLRGALSAHLQLQDCPVSSSSSEGRAIRVAQKLFSASSWQVNDIIPVDLRGVQVAVESNIWLHGYEADIVLRIGGEYRGMNIVDAIVNVEVDGPSHDSLKSRRFCSTRDWRMHREGVRVERWKVGLLVTPGKTETLLIELVQNFVQWMREKQK